MTTVIELTEVPSGGSAGRVWGAQFAALIRSITEAMSDDPSSDTLKRDLHTAMHILSWVNADNTCVRFNTVANHLIRARPAVEPTCTIDLYAALETACKQQTVQALYDLGRCIH